MQKNQRAITSGFEDLVMLQQLPGQAQAEQTSQLPLDYKPAMMEKHPNFNQIWMMGSPLMKFKL